MPRFFVDDVLDGCYTLRGEDAKHAIKSLRMKKGERVTLCSSKSIDYFCVIDKIENNEVFLTVEHSGSCRAEPNVKLTLYQGMPKSDKMDLIVQKCVEIGVYAVLPLITERSVSKPDEKSILKKLQRWQKISKEAAKQSGRGVIPQILPAVELKNIESLENFDCKIVFYEGGGEKLDKILNKDAKSVAIFIGPEGGFESEEVEKLVSLGASKASLGSRILRTETAAIVATAMTIYEREKNLEWRN